MNKYKATVSVMDNFYVEVDAEDDAQAEELAIEEAKKMYSEIGSVDPQFECEIIEESLDE